MAFLPKDETSWQVLPKDDTSWQQEPNIKSMHVYGSPTKR